MHHQLKHPLLLGVVALGVAGCARNAEVRLDQDYAPPTQRELRLTGTEAYFADDGERQRLIATFPLPGSQNGPRAFVLYLDTPSGGGSIGNGETDRADARGFVAQEVGALAGVQRFTEGTVHLSAVPLQPGWCSTTLDLRTERGAHIHGKALMQRSPRDLGRLARTYQTDIESMLPTTPKLASDEDGPASAEAPAQSTSDGEPRDE